ncbi:hypothetical protein [Falsirhodobacter deserti]|uniref:hypothetical protein n=1 Tax=Falsirhodobacter deserti TaxID=1365611 RepID=UPI0013E2FD8A|nr:hypothetical protein [Falsirhodobacter deserti]
MTTKPKTTWESTNAAATAIIDAETQARDEKTARLRAARKEAEEDIPKKPKGRKK